MTERLAKAKERMLSTKPSICIERARIYTQVYCDHEELPVVRRRSMALRRTLQEMTIYIEPDDLIVGNHSSRPKAAPIFPEYAVGWIIAEIDDIDKREAEAYQATQEIKSELKEICTFWKGKTLQERCHALMTPEMEEIHQTKIIKAEGNMTSGDGHVAANLRRIFELGIGGYRKLVEEAFAGVDCSTCEGLRKNQLYQAMLESLTGFSSYIFRFAELATRMAAGEADPARKAELDTIATTCAAIVNDPPATFREALQLSYFVQVVLQIESNGHSVSFGRLDQYLGPFYDRDIVSGVIDRETAKELLSATWLKLTAIKKVRSSSHTRSSAGGPLYQNVTIGGVDRRGRDAVNAMSYLILESVGDMKLTQPNLSVRYHKNMTSEFMAAVIAVIEKGFGMPAFNNDEIVIPGMLRLGVSLEDARDYSAIGCIEVAVPGKWGYRTTGMSFLNFMRVFMATLYDGREPESGKTFLPGTGRLEDFKSFEELMQAWKRQIQFYARASVAIDAAVDTGLEELVPDILCSTFTDDCIGRGKYIKEGGALYDWVSGLQVGIANLGNSMAAIKKFVFDEKTVDPKVLLHALETDFAGPEGEALRLRLLNGAPKFGNDNDEVDRLVVEGYGYYTEEIEKHHNTRYGRGPIGGGYYPGTSSISANVPAGSEVGATPDGRHAKAPLAEGCSPSGGTDVLGPTAVFNSIAKLPAERIFGGILLNQKLSPSVIAKKEDKQKLESLLRTFFDELKGWHVQYNIVSRETLVAAKKDPERYRDLVVRVAGYSAYFRDLPQDTQDDIIARTEHTL
ncbi:MAG: formate C-acetyltransferase/glycerol dehydratase family glycyl radical enzyme [Rectinema sp.]